jgi:hypothetical protein
MFRSLQHVQHFNYGVALSFQDLKVETEDAAENFTKFAITVADASKIVAPVQSDWIAFFKNLEKHMDSMSETSKEAWANYITGGKQGLDVLLAWDEALKSDVRYWILWLEKYRYVADEAKGGIPFPKPPPALDELDKQIQDLHTNYEEFVKLAMSSGTSLEELAPWIEKAKEYFGVSGLGVAAPNVPTPAAPAPVTVSINAPLVNVEGSADKRTVELAVEKVKEALKSTLVEASSSGAVTKRIRVVGGTTWA